MLKHFYLPQYNWEIIHVKAPIKGLAKISQALLLIFHVFFKCIYTINRMTDINLVVKLEFNFYLCYTKKHKINYCYIRARIEAPYNSIIIFVRPCRGT